MAKLNWGSAAGGAATGATIGSFGGPIGAGIGGVLGGVAGLFSGTKKAKVKQLPTQNKEQQELMKLINEGLSKGTGPYADLFNFNEESFNKGIVNPSLKNFQENILPQIQEKFIAGNQVAGSGMRRGQLKGATDLQSQLAQLMYQAQEQAKQNKLGGINSILGVKPFENIYEKAKEDPLSGIAQGAASGLGTAIGNNAANLFNKPAPATPAPVAQPVAG